MQNFKPANTTENKYFVGKTTRGINVVSPDTEMKYDHQEGLMEIRQYVFNPQFLTPTSLPLSFFFGYQILHEMKEWKKSGHVSLVIICFFLFCVFFFSEIGTVKGNFSNLKNRKKSKNMFPTARFKEEKKFQSVFN